MSIDVSRMGRALLITLDRPNKRNAIDSHMVDAITAAVAAGGIDGSVCAVVLRGRGEHFCAGADITQYHQVPAEQLRSFTVRARLMCETLSSCPVPVVSVVEGVALGGGMELCLASDIVLAHPNASFGLPELRLGLIPGWGGTQRLPNLVGRQRANHLVHTSGRLDTEAALSMGLIAEILDADDFEDSIRSYLHVLSTQSRGALVAAKAALSRAGTDTGPAIETALLMERFLHPDGIEGIAAFVERRPPHFADGSESKDHG